MILHYADMTGAISPIDKPGYYPVIEGDKPTPSEYQYVVDDSREWAGDHWIQRYRLQNLPEYTASEWLHLHDMGYTQQPTLIYLRLQLTAKGLQSPKLDAVEAYLQSILKIFADDQSPRCDWPLPSVSYEQAIKEATTLLEL